MPQSQLLQIYIVPNASPAKPSESPRDAISTRPTSPQIQVQLRFIGPISFQGGPRQIQKKGGVLDAIRAA